MRDLINPWVIVGVILTASLLLGISFFAAGSILPPSSNTYSGEAILTVIPIPTYTPTLPPTTPPQTPTEEPVSGIRVGGFVQITGTEGEGLRLRSEPTLGGEVEYLGLEGEIFQVMAGPEQRDGYLWWQLEAPLNEVRSGWAAANFLQPVQGP